MDYYGLKEMVIVLMNKNKVEIDIRGYQNDMVTFNTNDKEDVFTMLVHLGYLAYNSSTKEVNIPNKELYQEFELSTKDYQVS